MCGDGACEDGLGESRLNCPKDCEAQQPVTASLECQDVFDEATGLTKTECTGGPAQEHVCFEAPPGVLETCLSSGGTPETLVDEFGCPLTNCVLPGETGDIFLEKECLPQEQIDLFVSECQKNGLKPVVEAGIDGCFEPRCEGTEETHLESCKQYTPEETGQVHDNCAVQLGVLDYRFNSNGCKEPVCVTLNESLCYRVPEEAKKLCAAGGGEMVEVRDEAGCATYSYCLGDSGSGFEFEPVKQLPSREEIDATVDGLAELEAAIEIIAEKLGSLKAFFEISSDTSSMRKAEVAKSMLEGSAKSLKEMREFLFQNSATVTVEELSQIRAELGTISKSLEKALGVLLGAFGTGTQEENNCGSNMECLQNNLSTCTPSTATLFDTGVTFSVSITGIENDRCAMGIEATVDNEPLSMACRYADYALGILGGQETESFLDSCEGNLVEYMYPKVN